jgi:hypothetical protein
MSQIAEILLACKGDPLCLRESARFYRDVWSERALEQARSNAIAASWNANCRPKPVRIAASSSDGPMDLLIKSLVVGGFLLAGAEWLGRHARP